MWLHQANDSSSICNSCHGDSVVSGEWRVESGSNRCCSNSYVHGYCTGSMIAVIADSNDI